MTTPHEHNRKAWDAMVREKQRFTIPASDADFVNPLQKVDQLGWLGPDIRGRKLLCLAAGGGKHGPLYAKAGAEVTVVDISPAMLELDRVVAAERGLSLRTVETSMDQLGMFQPGEFEIVIHPVSTCYVPEIAPVYREVARVMAAGGVYVSQHKTPANLQAEQGPTPRGYELSEPYYRSGPLPPVLGSRLREEGTLEYLHRWEQLLGYLCRAGFVIEDVAEPQHGDPQAAAGSFGHRCSYIAPYIRIKARRTGEMAASSRLILLDQ
jgi:SAM-dependent methyltransferase